MKTPTISIHSDIHTEQGNNIEIKIDNQTDILILAGDIGIGAMSPKIIRDQLKNITIPIVYIAGNHEFYCDEYHRVIDDLKTECKKYDILFLNDELIRIGDSRAK